MHYNVITQRRLTKSAEPQLFSSHAGIRHAPCSVPDGGPSLVEADFEKPTAVHLFFIHTFSCTSKDKDHNKLIVVYTLRGTLRILSNSLGSNNTLGQQKQETMTPNVLLPMRESVLGR